MEKFVKKGFSTKSSFCDDFESNSHILTASKLKTGKLQTYVKNRIAADTISKEYSSRLQYRVVNVAEL